MVVQSEQGWMVRARFAGAQAVHLVGLFNNWSTMATPMSRGDADVWEAVLPPETMLGELRYFVWRPGEIAGRLCNDEDLAPL